jgi:hypothetical protein
MLFLLYCHYVQGALAYVLLRLPSFLRFSMAFLSSFLLIFIVQEVHFIYK